MRFNIQNPAFLQAGCAGVELPFFWIKSLEDQNDFTTTDQAFSEWCVENLQFSFDKGKTWNDYVGDHYILNSGSMILFKNKTGNSLPGNEGGDPCFGLTKKFSAGGDITSLLYPGIENLPDFALYYLFGGTRIVSAGKMTIKAKSCGADSISNMFDTCEYLEDSPIILVDSVLATGASGVFKNCGSLKSIKCLTKNVENTAFGDWVVGVPGSGIITISSEADFWGTNGNLLPEGWTVVRQ